MPYHEQHSSSDILRASGVIIESGESEQGWLKNSTESARKKQWTQRTEHPLGIAADVAAG
jgi:hypothetical protein